MPDEGIISPTLERHRHSIIEVVPKAIADEDGRPSQPYRTIDVLAAMERRGKITPQMRSAGEDFRDDFRKAICGDLRATDMARPYISGTRCSGYEIGSVGARKRMYKALDAIGGSDSQNASIVWHVIGLEMTLKGWAQMYSTARLRFISPQKASLILIGALEPLARHYGY
jgi:hypothetical protein